MTQDPATLDQLRVLVAIAETGSFSAAGRRLNRVQSAVSHAVASMEEQFGAPLFERTSRRVRLTPAGDAVLAIARGVCARADALRQLAAALNRAEEPALGVAVDVLYPGPALAAACRDFATAWPAVQLRLHTDTLGAVAGLVRDGRCAFGVVGPAADTRGLVLGHLGEVRMVPVVAASHPLAAGASPVGAERLAEEVQIVLSERDAADETPDQAVLSNRTWRVHDLHTKRLLLLEGLGWGNLPESLVAEDLGAGRLARLYPAAWPAAGIALTLSVVTRPDRAPGLAGRWLIERLEQGCRAAMEVER
ncbi:MAG: LysR family transcriptional regulator [Pseudomonadota bacterium]|nr:LysR family transcriptional regulator [Pseudomonadota bacterium]